MKKRKESIEDFCDMYLTHISDDDTVKYKVHTFKIALVHQYADNDTRSKITNSLRFNCIEIYRERIRRITNYYGETYDKCDEIAFKWSDVKEDITQFILMCEYKFGLSKRQSPIIFTNRYGIAVTIPINDLDDLDPDSIFYKIYINLIE